MVVRIALLVLTAVGSYFNWVAVIPYAIYVIADIAKELIPSPTDPNEALRRRIEELESRIAKVEFNQI